MLTYVTSNIGKYNSVKKHFELKGYTIDYYKYDLYEPSVNDIEFISHEKAHEAYELIKRPVFTIDSGLYINSHPLGHNYPGAFAKRSGVTTNIDKLLLDMKDVSDRRLTFVDSLTFFDGINDYTFNKESVCTLSYQKRGTLNENAKSNLWLLLIPEGYTKTLAEFTNEELLLRKKKEISATTLFIDFLMNDYKDTNLILKKL